MIRAQYYFGDPWLGTRKPLCILYQYEGRGLELAVTHEEGGILRIDHEAPLDTRRTEFLKHRSHDQGILAVVWGTSDGLRGRSGSSRKAAIARSESFPCTVEWFGFDGYDIGGNCCVVFVKDGDIIKGVARKEYESCQLPAKSFFQSD
jgi:hypothetical protein